MISGKFGKNIENDMLSILKPHKNVKIAVKFEQLIC